MRRVLITLLVAVVVAPAAAQPTKKDTTARELVALRTELGRVRAELEIMKGQLAQVIRLLNQRQPAAGGAGAGAALSTGPARASVAGAPFLGPADAPVTIVEFSDYECPFCQRFFATTLPALKKDYVETGKVRYVFRDHPLDQIHPHARKAAEAAHCAGDEGKFWEMHDRLFQHPTGLAPPQLTEHARALGLDAARFDGCLSSGRHAARVERGLADGAAAGVRGTPAFVIGKTKPGSDLVEGTPVRGAQSLETLRRILEPLLATPAERPASPP